MTVTITSPQSIARVGDAVFIITNTINTLQAPKTHFELECVMYTISTVWQSEMLLSIDLRMESYYGHYSDPA